MVGIAKLFEADSESEFELYHLTSEAVEEFKERLPKILRDCLLSDDKLASLLSRPNAPSRAELIRSVIPDISKIMSGDFGEILTYAFLKDRESRESVAVLKWRWKEDKNESAHKSDVLIYFLGNGKAGCNEDWLLVAEVKSKAKRHIRNSLNDAIKGAQDDHLQRLAKTLDWAKDKYRLDGDFQRVDELDRFVSKAIQIPHRRRFCASLVVDQSLLSEELSKPLDKFTFEDEFVVLLLSLPNLADLRNTIFSKTLET